MSAKQLQDERSTPKEDRAVMRVATAQLMQGRREIIIQHGSQEYRLRITSNGKLILTK